jgi:hypothetical protein
MEKIKRALNESPFSLLGILFLVGLILSLDYYSIPNKFLLIAVIGGLIQDHTGPGNPEVLTSGLSY